MWRSNDSVTKVKYCERCARARHYPQPYMYPTKFGPVELGGGRAVEMSQVAALAKYAPVYLSQLTKSIIRIL